MPGVRAAAADGFLSIDVNRALSTYMISGTGPPESLVVAIERALDAGVDRVQIRLRDAPGGPVEWIGRRVLRARPEYRSRLLVNDRLDVALALNLGGVHLPANGFAPDAVRRVAPAGFVVGVSTHSKEDVVRAERAGADFVVYGPVFPTPSKPGHPGHGVDRLKEAVDATGLPVYALGGITCERVPEVAATGARGVASISMFATEDALRRTMGCVE